MSCGKCQQPYNHRGVHMSKKKKNYIKHYPPLSALIYPPRSCLAEHFKTIFQRALAKINEDISSRRNIFCLKLVAYLA